MKVAVGERWQAMIASAVESGRYTSAEDVVAQALNLLAAREERLEALRASLAEALADPREVSEAEMDAALAEVDARLRAEGYR